MHLAQSKKNRATRRIEEGRNQRQTDDRDDVEDLCRVSKPTDRAQHQTNGDKSAPESQDDRMKHLSGSGAAMCAYFAHEKLWNAETAHTLKHRQPRDGESIGAEQLCAGHLRYNYE